MKNSSSKSENNEEYDWKSVLFEVVIKILTLGFYHIKKRKEK